jgi:uncharacterized protein (TIGR03503 family)
MIRWMVILISIWVSTAGYAVESVEQSSLLNNRFRIDYMVESITLLIERKFGSEAVILVQPTGEKLYFNRYPNTVKWANGDANDIIMIRDPMPGPWQIIGNLQPNSKIKIISRLGVRVEPYPETLYQGETLKIQAALYGEQLPIRMKGLDYLVNWTVRLVSLSDEDIDNSFTTGSITIGSYNDQGTNFDERPDDGIFTADLKLLQPAGMYLLQVNIDNPVFARQYQQYVTILPKPIKVQEKILEVGDDTSYFVLALFNEVDLDLTQTHIELTIDGPKQISESMLVTKVFGNEMLLPMSKAGEPGNYRIKGIAYATTKQGREVVFSIDEVIFNIPTPPPVVTEADLRKEEENRKKRELERIERDPYGEYKQLLNQVVKSLNDLIYAWHYPEDASETEEEASKSRIREIILLNIVALLALALIVPGIFKQKIKRKRPR